MNVTIVDSRSVICNGAACDVVSMINDGAECGSCPVYELYRTIDRTLYGGYVTETPSFLENDTEEPREGSVR